MEESKDLRLPIADLRSKIKNRQSKIVFGVLDISLEVHAANVV